MNIMQSTFYPHFLQEEAHWVVEYNGCTYDGSVGCWVLCYHQSASSIFTNQADKSHLD